MLVPQSPIPIPHIALISFVPHFYTQPHLSGGYDVFTLAVRVPVGPVLLKINPV